MTYAPAATTCCNSRCHAALHALTTLTGWKKYFLAFFLGAFMVLAMPPTGFFPALFISLPLIMLMTAASATRRAAFLTGWAFGAGYFIVGLYWFAVAFKTFFSYMIWMTPFVVIIIPLYIALYYGLAALIAWHARRHGTLYALVYATLFFWAEYLRSHYITDFPWNALGYGWHHVLPVLQSTALFGIYGLTFATIFWTAAPLMRGVFRWVSVISFFAVLGFGYMLLLQNPVQMPGDGDTMVRIVQPNISQAQKQDTASHGWALRRQLSLSSQMTPAGSQYDYLIWPETAIDIINPGDIDQLAEIGAVLPPGAIALVGATLAENEGTFNTLLAINGAGQVVGRHNKFILAPWGEYMPYENILRHLPFYDKISIQRLNAGPGPQTLRPAGKASFSPVICFESTFTGQITHFIDRPDFLLFMTNDAWSMGSVGPYQHYGMARVRAIEEGLPIVRAANTGISGTIDAYGRIITHMGLDTTGLVDAAIPPARSRTPYAVMGDDGLLLAMLAWSLSLLLASVLQRRKS